MSCAEVKQKFQELVEQVSNVEKEQNRILKHMTYRILSRLKCIDNLVKRNVKRKSKEMTPNDG